MAKDSRYRQWAFVVYPESAPEDWCRKLDEYHVPWYQSPLHDKDVNPTGEPKKAHWHVIIQYTGKQTYERVKEVTDSINASRPEPVKELKGYLRYFAHLDNPEKAQYSVNDITAHGGADISYLTTPTASERHMYLNEMRKYIRENNIIEFSDFYDVAAEIHPMDWFPLLCDNSAYIIQLYITSRRNKHIPSSVPVCDSETGEVIEDETR